jgi:hypothetical protein
MKKVICLLMVLAGIHMGCSVASRGGAGAKALGPGAGDKIQDERQMNQLEELEDQSERVRHP